MKISFEKESWFKNHCIMCGTETECVYDSYPIEKYAKDAFNKAGIIIPNFCYTEPTGEPIRYNYCSSNCTSVSTSRWVSQIIKGCMEHLNIRA